MDSDKSTEPALSPHSSPIPSPVGPCSSYVIKNSLSNNIQTGPFGEMADLKAKRGYVQDELGTSCYARKEALEKKK